LALFKRKSKSDEDNPQANADSDAMFTPEPEKAERFFQRAAQMVVTEQYEYALQLFVDGFRWDPTAISQLEKFRKASEGYVNGGGKPASMKEKSKYGGKTAFDKYLRALFAWGKDPLNPSNGLDVMKYAVDLELGEFAYRIGEFTLNRVPTAKRGAQKDLYLKLMNAFAAIQAFDQAVQAGESAIRLDPENRKLVNTVRSFSAEATIKDSGYGEVGAEGGFRRFIRDDEGQQRLLDAESLVKSEDAATRALNAAREAYEEDPTNQNNIRHYLRLLQESDTPEHDQLAMKIAEQAYEDTQQFQFRRISGELKLRQARAVVFEYQKKAQAPDATEEDRTAYRRRRAGMLKLELDEYAAQVEAYPTDLGLRYELGRRQFAVGQYDEAVGTLQAAKGDPKHRAQVLSMLGQCFAKKGWALEAIETFRDGLEAHFTDSDDLGYELRYSLMDALEAEARNNQDLEQAKEAFSIASAIAMEQINYKDISDRRTKLHELLGELKSSGASGS
jgi:hypothetical protein